MLLQSGEIKRLIMQKVDEENIDMNLICKDICPAKKFEGYLTRLTPPRGFSERFLIEVAKRLGIEIRYTVTVKEEDLHEYRKADHRKGYTAINTELNRRVDELSA